jgi:LytB protein
MSGARLMARYGVRLQGDVTVKLAEAYGYCWGVERAVQMAYEARRAYPGQKLHITNEIIHNPSVNKVPPYRWLHQLARVSAVIMSVMLQCWY